MRARYFFALMAVALLVLALTQFVIFQQSLLLGEWLYRLLLVNVALIVLITGGVLTAAVRFWRQWRKGGGGSLLAKRLTAWFLAIALLPAGALYVVSAGGIFRGIESWFSTPLGHAFAEGEAFGKHVLGLEFNRLLRDARNLAQTLDGGQALPFWRYDLQLLYQVDNVVMYDENGAPLDAVGEAEPLSAPARKELAENRAYHNVSEGSVRHLEVVVPMPGRRGSALKVSRALPEGIDSGLAEISRGREAYQQLLILRRGLVYSFFATLTLTFVIVLAMSLWASMRLGAHLFRPLTRMAKAAVSVGHGDFDYRLPVGEQDDEIAQVSRAFNTMVDDLGESRRQIGERQRELSSTNNYLENLLSSMTSGVLTVDADGRLKRFNGNAEVLLGVSLGELSGQHFEDWTTMPEIAKMTREVMDGNAESEDRLSLADGRTLLVRLRRLPPPGGVLIMADDISREIDAERETVWQEASQRFAHEIKNPLTPIQLAADRLKTKLAGKLDDKDEKLLIHLSDIITRQIVSMREMVDTFRLYAGGRSRRKTSLDLNAVAAEVAQLYERPQLTLRMDWVEELPQVRGDATLLRQALHNIMGNAVEAAAASPSPLVAIKTALENGHAAVIIEDNGGGVPQHIKIFKPYQTSKEKGTGLGLVIVRKIMEEHGGEACLENIPGGARAILRFPLPSEPAASESAAENKIRD